MEIWILRWVAWMSAINGVQVQQSTLLAHYISDVWSKLIDFSMLYDLLTLCILGWYVKSLLALVRKELGNGSTVPMFHRLWSFLRSQTKLVLCSWPLGFVVPRLLILTKFSTLSFYTQTFKVDDIWGNQTKLKIFTQITANLEWVDKGTWAWEVAHDYIGKRHQ